MIKFKPYQKSIIPYQVQWLNNPKTNRFISDEKGKKTTLRKEMKWYEEYKKDRNKKFFAILDGTLPIGCVGLSKISKAHKQAELFIIIGDDRYHGRGIGKQSLKFIIDYGFKKLQLHKISLNVFEQNEIAVKSFESAGFGIEGILKDDVIINGRYHNMVLMAIFNQ